MLQMGYGVERVASGTCPNGSVKVSSREQNVIQFDSNQGFPVDISDFWVRTCISTWRRSHASEVPQTSVLRLSNVRRNKHSDRAARAPLNGVGSGSVGAVNSNPRRT